MGLNSAYERDETRGFLKRRLTALVMVILMLFAFVLAFGLLVLGPHLSGWIGEAVGIEAVIDWLWWTVQWPLLILGLLVAFATILYLGPNVDHPRWQFLTFGTALAVVVWLLGSGAFAVFVSQFGSYNKAWGSVAAVIVMLTWLWLSALALLFGAELNAEAERSRELRRGEPAEVELQAPARSIAVGTTSTGREGRGHQDETVQTRGDGASREGKAAVLAVHAHGARSADRPWPYRSPAAG